MNNQYDIMPVLRKNAPVPNASRLRLPMTALLLMLVGWVTAQTTFNYTGAVQTYSVPLTATQITVDVYGAAGFGLQGFGGRVQATYPVTGGEVLNIYVGGQGDETTGGFNGGGNAGTNTGYGAGGGASDIRQGGSGLANRIIVAGGGGGSGSNCGTWTAEGGHGGGLVGQSGCAWSCSDCQYTGAGGTQSAGGIAGPTAHTYCPGNTNGTLGQGGSNTQLGYGTGGGGGYYGGGSGCFEGAGGGSSYTGPLATAVTHTQGVRQGNGMIVITPNNAPPCPAPSNVVAVPTMVCPGTPSNLSAISVGNTIAWYTVPTAGTMIGTSASGANFPVTPVATTTYYAEASGTGCSASPRVAVTVTLDNVAPVAVCQAATVTLDSTGNGSISGSAVGSGSTDNCSVSTLVLGQSAFTCSDVGSNSIVLTATDGNGNTDTCMASITVIGPAINSSVSALTTSCGYNVSCHGGSDGIATVSTTGGCAPFTFLWSNGATSATATGLAAGVHQVTVTDASGSTHVTSITVTEPSAVQVASILTMACEGDSTGAIDITTTGGNDCSAYAFAWDNGSTSEDLSNVVPANYTVTVTDANGCTSVHTITLTAFATPAPTFTVSGNLLTSGQTWATYQWLLNGTAIPGANADNYDAALTGSGSYALSVTDSNGCTGLSNGVQVTVVGLDGRDGDWAGLSVLPNPTHGSFHLRAEQPISTPIKLTVKDIFGRNVLQREYASLGREVAIDLRSYPAGTYLVEVTSEAGQYKLFRLVIQ